MVVAATLVSALTYMLLSNPGTVTLDQGLSMRLFFPLVVLLATTRTMLPYFRNIHMPAGRFGKRGWQKMYNKIRLAYIFFALGAVTFFALWDFFDSQAGAPYRGAKMVLAFIACALNFYMLFTLKQAAKDLSLEKEG